MGRSLHGRVATETASEKQVRAGRMHEEASTPSIG
jgi:hypothetical protein